MVFLSSLLLSATNWASQSGKQQCVAAMGAMDIFSVRGGLKSSLMLLSVVHGTSARPSGSV